MPKLQASPLMVRMDKASKNALTKAAKLRGISVSDYVRQVVVTQAKREVARDITRTITLKGEDARAFLKALDAPVRLTPAQKKLGRIMRGEEQ